MANYVSERAWIKKKYKQGVTKAELRDSVGAFSNKDKKEVMKQKNLTSKQYDRRYKFLSNVYYLLDN